MKHIFFVQYFRGKDWKATYFGDCYDHHAKMFYFESFNNAKKDIERQHDYEKEIKKKKLTKYRIVERIYDETIHTI